MFRPLLFLFIVIPIIEISILMQVGEWLGAWPTVAIVIFTAWLGAKNVRQQGISTLQSVQNKMAQGQMPSQEIVAGVLLLVAGVLLMTPGFVTDTFGLLLLVPAFRGALIGTVQEQIKLKTVSGASFSHQHFHEQGHQGNNVYDHEDDSFNQAKSPFENELHSIQQQEQPRQGKTLDGEFERKD